MLLFAGLLLVFLASRSGVSPPASYNYPSGSYIVGLDGDRLRVISKHGGLLAGSLFQIEDPEDVKGLRVYGASWSVDHVGGAGVPIVGEKALRLDIPPGGVAVVRYPLPSGLVGAVAGGSVEASASITAVAGDAEALVGVAYSPGPLGGCVLLALNTSQGQEVASLGGDGVFIAGEDVRGVELAGVGGCESRVGSLRFYSVEVPQGYTLAYTPGGVALLDLSMVSSVDLGLGGLSYPLLPGGKARFTVSPSEAGYVVLELTDPLGGGAALGLLHSAGLPLPVGVVTVAIGSASYTIGPRSPLAGLYLFPVEAGGSVEVEVVNRGLHPVAISSLGLVDGGHVKVIGLDELPMVHAEGSPGLPDILGRVEARLSSHQGVLVIEYNITGVKGPSVTVVPSPAVGLNPGLGGWVSISTGVARISGSATSIELLLLVHSRSGATVMVDNIYMDYMPTVIVGHGYFTDPGARCLLPVACHPGRHAQVEYTYIITFKVEEVNVAGLNPRAYSLVASLGYTVLARGYTFTETGRGAPILSLGIELNAATGNALIIPYSIYTSNDKGIPGEPPPTIETGTVPYKHLTLTAQTLTLLQGTPHQPLYTKTGITLTPTLAKTPYKAPNTTHKDQIQIDYKKNKGVNNATIGLTINYIYTTSNQPSLTIKYNMPPGPTYPSNNTVTQTITIKIKR